MIRAKFFHTIFGEEFKVIASAKDVDSYGAVSLKLRLYDKNGEESDIFLDKGTFEEISEIADELLYEAKYSKELEF